MNDDDFLLRYLAFLAIIVPFELALVTAALVLIRRRTCPEPRNSWLWVLGMVFLLMLAVNLASLVPVLGVVAVIIWLVGLKKLSGLSVLPTFVLSIGLGIVVLVAMIVAAKYLEVPLVGQHIGE